MTQSYPSLLPSRIELDIARAKVDRFANGFFVCDFDYWGCSVNLLRCSRCKGRYSISCSYYAWRAASESNHHETNCVHTSEIGLVSFGKTTDSVDIQITLQLVGTLSRLTCSPRSRRLIYLTPNHSTPQPPRTCPRNSHYRWCENQLWNLLIISYAISNSILLSSVQVQLHYFWM